MNEMMRPMLLIWIALLSVVTDRAQGQLLNNTKIAFVSDRDGNHEIYSMAVDGSNQQRLTNNSVSDEVPFWSPDGKKIAFYSDRDSVPYPSPGYNFEIYVMDADGSNQVRLTYNPADDRIGGWSPDGSKIVFVSNRGGSGFDIYTMNSDGTNLQRLTDNSTADGSPSWSPDGSKIAFYSERDGNPEIYVMNADGQGQLRLTNNSYEDFYPAWSPDGSKIVFQSNRDGNFEIYLMDTDGSGQTRLTNHSASDDWPHWSPDNSKIVFESTRDGNREIYVMDANGMNVTRLTNNPALDNFPFWSPILAITPPIVLTAVPGSGQVTLRWQRNLESNFLRYRIFVGNSPGATSQLDSTSGGNLDTVKTVGINPNGAVFYFRVAAVDSALNQSDYSNEVYATPSANLPGEYSVDVNTAMLLHMDEASGNIVTDASGNSNHGVASGSTIVDGKFEKSRSFTTTFEQISIQDSPTLDFGTGTFTAEAWINTLGLPNVAGHPHHKRGTGGIGWFTSIGDGLISVSVNPYPDSNSGISGTRYVADGQWHHIAVIISNTDMQLYVDGELDAQRPILSPGSVDNDGVLVLGLQGGNPFPFRGLMDEVRISNTARSPDEFNLQLRPTALAGTPSLNTIDLTWQNGGGGVPLLRYRIYRGADSTNMSLIDSTTSESYQNTGLTPNTTYYYRVSAVDQSGFGSLKSFAEAITTAEQIPTINSTSFVPNPPFEGEAVAVTATVSGSNPVVKLFYARGGQTQMDSIVLTLVSGSQFSGSIPASAVTREGLRYRIRAQNGAGIVYSPSASDGAIPVRVGSATITTIQNNSAFPDGIQSDGYYTVCLPLDTTYLWASILGSQQFNSKNEPTNWRAQRFINGAFTDETIVQSGQAYFVQQRTGYDDDLPVSGTTNPPGTFDNFLLRPGWNLVPWPHAFSANLTITDAAKIGSVWLLNRGNWSPSTIVKPYGAYAIYNKSLDSSYIVSRVLSWSPILTRSAGSFSWTWSIQISASADRYADEYNFAAVSEHAADLNDPEPPLLGSGIRLAFGPSDAGRYASDVRPPHNDGQSWDLFLANRTGQKDITLSWKMERLPDDHNAVLVDLSNNRFIDLRLSDPYRFDVIGTNRLKLIVGNADYVQRQTDELRSALPSEFTLKQNFPNPFNPSTTIPYDIFQKSRVRLSIYNILGQEVRRLVDGVHEPGRYTVVWNGKDSRGHAVSSGVYVVRLAVTRFNREAFVMSRKLQLLK
jgi:hypothetical protein